MRVSQPPSAECNADETFELAKGYCRVYDAKLDQIKLQREHF